MLQEVEALHGLRQVSLSPVSGLHGSTIHALDGEVGTVDEILFDDEHWTVRYVIVNTGNWLSNRKVLISPMAFGLLDWDRFTLNVNLTREQLENSPGVETDEPVSRRWERNYYDYFAWPYYWGNMGGMGGVSGMGGWGSYRYPGALLAQPFGDAARSQQQADDPARDHADAHLRSTKEVTGYGISATDGHLGHIDDFIVDDETWQIRYLAVDTRDWWPGKKVLLPPDWIGQVNWPDRNVTVNVTRDQVRNAPEWDPYQPISRAFEDQLNGYYARQRPQDREQPKSDMLEQSEQGTHKEKPLNRMNNVGTDITAQPSQATSRTLLYFRFRHDVGGAIQQVEYDLLQTNLSQHRGHNDNADALCREGYWAVVATSETGLGADAVAYTTNYLRSMPVVDEFSITTTPPAPSQS